MRFQLPQHRANAFTDRSYGIVDVTADSQPGLPLEEVPCRAVPGTQHRPAHEDDVGDVVGQPEAVEVLPGVALLVLDQVRDISPTSLSQVLLVVSTLPIVNAPAMGNLKR